MATTRWNDTESQSINDTLNKILTHENAEDTSSDKTRYSNWQTTKTFSDNLKYQFNNKEIEFNYISFSYDTITPDDGQPVEDRTTNHRGFIILYWNGQSVNYIINQKAYALTILRKLLGYTGRNKIIQVKKDIASDFFLWLIYKVYSLENVFERDDEQESTKNITIEMIRGIKGETDDTLTKVSANGDSVMNIISTLSFLLESREFNQICIDINYMKHSHIELTLDTKGTINTSVEAYCGEFDTGKETKEEVTAKLFLLIYLEVFPFIYQTYILEKDDSLWNKDINIEFLNQVADDLSTRVKEKIELLNSVVSQANLQRVRQDNMQEVNLA